MSIVRKELEKWLATKEVKGRTLDIGGDIYSIRHKVKSFEGKYETFDESVDDLNNCTTLPFEYYDNIFCTEVMQFLYNPCNALFDLRLALKNGGKLYLSIHLTHEPMKGHDYLRYTAKGIKKLLEVEKLQLDEFIEPLPGFFLIQCSRKKI